ncbi:NAD-dependent epimerase/dehydratase family protein [Alistipes putredinis]|uniref:NAD-dependent epimerase/dehydratase family protein n=1 Tax=Alistipes putredinis TaxID=28117 RepID=UPI003996A873
MKILVTGANGYIGLHIVKTLLDKGIQVIACDLNTDEVANAPNGKTSTFSPFPIQTYIHY